MSQVIPRQIPHIQTVIKRIKYAKQNKAQKICHKNLA